MGNSQLIAHYNDKQASLHLYLKETSERQGIEDIHQLRLTIKKMRATWSLMELISHGALSKKSYSSLFSTLFDEAGEVREAQVNLTLVQKSNALYLLPYADFLKETENRANKKLLVAIHTFDFKKFEVLNSKLLPVMKGIPVEMALGKSAAFVLNKIKKVEKLKNHLPNNRKLHKIRIHLKAAIEILTIMDKFNDAVSLSKYHKKFKIIDRQIGKWHDNIMLLTSLNYFTNQNLEENNIQYLMNLIRRIEDKQDLRQQNIHELINKHITQQELKPIEDLL